MLITSTPASAATATATNYSELVAAIAAGDEIEIEGNITLEDDEVTDGLTVNLINDTHITVPKGIKLTNKGKIYVDGTSSIRVCRDDYEGDEADIYGEGKFPSIVKKSQKSFQPKPQNKKTQLLLTVSLSPLACLEPRCLAYWPQLAFLALLSVALKA